MNEQITDTSAFVPVAATFGLRALAKMVDLLALSGLQLALFCLVAILDAIGVLGLGWVIALLTAYVMLAIGYFAFWSSGGRRTWGYRLAGLQVQTEQGQPIGFGRSLGRATLDFVFLSLLGYGVGLIAYLPIAFSRSKRAVHDLVTGTTVVRVVAPRSAALALASFASAVAPFVIVFCVVRPFLMQSYYIPSPSMTPTLQIDDHLIVNKLAVRLHPPRRQDIVTFDAPEKLMPGRPTFLKRVLGVPGDLIETVRGRVIVDGQEFNHQSVRDRLGAAGMFGQSAMSDIEVAQAYHHVKFVPDGVLADGQLVSKSRLAQILTGHARASVTVRPGYDLRNGRRLEEPFTAEDPDYDLQISHGQPLKHMVDSQSLPGAPRDVYYSGGVAISPNDYRHDRVAPPERVPQDQLFVIGDNRNDSNDSANWGFLPMENVTGKATLLYSPEWRRL